MIKLLSKVSFDFKSIIAEAMVVRLLHMMHIL